MEAQTQYQAMGIQGLLPQLRSITSRTHISKYDGKTVAVDAYCLLHRGAYACARELVEGEPTSKHIFFCMARLELLQRNGVIPYVVFDGGSLPNKRGEEMTRANARDNHRERARALWRQGNRTAAIEAYQKAVDVTPETAHGLIMALKSVRIQFIVAPYEADAQLAYLALHGLVDAVLTEDSDLLAYGCPIVLFKLDGNGEVDEVMLSDLPQCRELNFTGWTQELFQQMCVMAGCDFVKALPGIGIKRAHAQIRRTRDFHRALRALRFDGVQIPSGYEISVQRALWTFRHQRVFCPRRREIVHLTEPPGGKIVAHTTATAAIDKNDDEDTHFLGPTLAVHVAQGIAEGRLNPLTHMPYLATERPFQQDKFRGIRNELGASGGVEAIPATIPVPKVSTAARSQFKKPRTAGLVGLGSVVKASQCVSTVKRYFTPAGEGPAHAGPPTDRARAAENVPLFATLQAALQQDDHITDASVDFGYESDERAMRHEAGFNSMRITGQVPEHVEDHLADDYGANERGLLCERSEGRIKMAESASPQHDEMENRATPASLFLHRSGGPAVSGWSPPSAVPATEARVDLNHLPGMVQEAAAVVGAVEYEVERGVRDLRRTGFTSVSPKRKLLKTSKCADHGEYDKQDKNAGKAELQPFDKFACRLPSRNEF